MCFGKKSPGGIGNPGEENLKFWRIVRVAPTSAPTRVRTLAARGTSAPEAKVLTTGPSVVPYTSVIGAGLFLHIAPPKYRDTWEDSRGVWRRAEREMHVAARISASAPARCVTASYRNPCNMRDLWISRRGHHFGGLLGSLQLLPRPGFEPSPLGDLCTGSKGLDHWTTSGVLCFRDRGRAFLHKPIICALTNLSSE